MVEDNIMAELAMLTGICPTAEFDFFCDIDIPETTEEEKEPERTERPTEGRETEKPTEEPEEPEETEKPTDPATEQPEEQPTHTVKTEMKFKGVTTDNWEQVK